jgi:SAM-dependent methyltransferase
MSLEDRQPPSEVATTSPYDPAPGFAFIEQFYQQDPAAVDATGASALYPWGGRLEEHRLQEQNAPGSAWGDGHHAHQVLQLNSGFVPEEVIEIGVGKDARLVHNVASAYGGKGLERILVVDQDSSKLSGARDNVVAAGVTDQVPVHFIHTNAMAMPLAESGKSRLVDVQLLFVHLGKDDMGKVLREVSRVLRPGDRATFSDLMMSDWDARPAPGEEQNPKAQAYVDAIKRFINGDPEDKDNPMGFKGATHHAWRMRGAALWENVAEFASMITELSGNQLVQHPDPQLHTTTGETLADGTNRMSVVTAHMGPAVEMGLRIAQRNLEALARVNPDAPQLRALGPIGVAIPKVHEYGEKRLEALRSGLVVETVPTMHWLTFVKK